MSPPPVSLIHCQRDVGAALEDFLDGRRRNTHSYSMFDATQAALARPTWSVKAPEETELLAKLDSMPKLKDVALVRQGVITGADEVFLIDSGDVPRGEEVLYRPLLPDRMISRFALPLETGRRIFYPYIENIAVTAEQIKSEFPETWNRLANYKGSLSGRASVRKGSQPWWRPDSPRSPLEMLSPKIVVPEVFLVPRFGLDVRGNWVVSHSPFVCARTRDTDDALLFLLTAFLNSSVSAWYIDSNARKFRSQYNKIGVSLLRQVPVPDLTLIPLQIRRRIIAQTNQLSGRPDDFDVEMARALDDLVMRKAFGLTDDEVELVAP